MSIVTLSIVFLDQFLKKGGHTGSEKKLKIIIGIFIVVFLWMFLFGRNSGPRYGDVNIQAMAATAADGLDLKAVGELVKQARNAEDLEKLQIQDAQIRRNEAYLLVRCND